MIKNNVFFFNMRFFMFLRWVICFEVGVWIICFVFFLLILFGIFVLGKVVFLKYKCFNLCLCIVLIIILIFCGVEKFGFKVIVIGVIF